MSKAYRYGLLARTSVWTLLLFLFWKDVINDFFELVDTVLFKVVCRLLKKDFIYFRGEGRERETSMCGCLLCTPYWGPGLQPRHVP